MNKGNALPVFARGFDRVRLALQTSLSGGANVDGSLDAATEPMRWSSACLRDDYEVRYRRNLDALGYRGADARHALGCSTRVPSSRAVFRRGGCCIARDRRALERSASSSNWIISKRVRAVTERSRFIDDMMHDRAFLLRVSRLAGVPLIPYPMVNARSQFNYYYPTSQRDGKEQLGMWHTDGTSRAEHRAVGSIRLRGRKFSFYESTAETFDRHDRERRHVKTANLDNAGDALLIYGSKLFHGVEPVESGRRCRWCCFIARPRGRTTTASGISRRTTASAHGRQLALQARLRDDAELVHASARTDSPRGSGRPAPSPATSESRRPMQLFLLQFVFVLSWSSGFIGAKLGRGDGRRVQPAVLAVPARHAVPRDRPQPAARAPDGRSALSRGDRLPVAVSLPGLRGDSARPAARHRRDRRRDAAAHHGRDDVARRRAQRGAPVGGLVGFVGVGIVIGGQACAAGRVVGDVPAAAGVRAGAVDRDDHQRRAR